MSKILLAGNDLRLLATRAALMARTHAGVQCCTAAQATKAVQTRRPDLMVLCHSLTDAQVSEITDSARRCSPRTRILMVVSNVSRERFYHGARFDAMSTAEPSRLLNCAFDLLKPPTHHIDPGMPITAERSA